MSEEERTHTEVSALHEIGGERPSPLPWVLFGVSVLLLALVGGLLAKRLSTEVKRANAESERSATLEAKLHVAESARDDADKRATAAEAARKDADEAAAELGERVKKLEAGPKKEDPPPKVIAGKKAKPTKGKKKKKKSSG